MWLLGTWTLGECVCRLYRPSLVQAAALGRSWKMEEGSGLRVYGSGSRVQGVYSLGSRVQGVYNLGSRVQGVYSLGFRVQGSRL